jgi:hypothetical protein
VTWDLHQITFLTCFCISIRFIFLLSRSLVMRYWSRVANTGTVPSLPTTTLLRSAPSHHPPFNHTFGMFISVTFYNHVSCIGEPFPVDINPFIFESTPPSHVNHDLRGWCGFMHPSSICHRIGYNHKLAHNHSYFGGCPVVRPCLTQKD